MTSYDTAHIDHTLRTNETPSNHPPHIRGATADDAARMRAIALAAYANMWRASDVSRRRWVADYEAEVAANRAVVIEAAEASTAT